MLFAGLKCQPVGGRAISIDADPDESPGQAAFKPDRTDMNPAWGPPKPIGTPKRCAEPTTMSAPSAPGDSIRSKPTGLLSQSPSRLWHLIALNYRPDSVFDFARRTRVAHAPPRRITRRQRLTGVPHCGFLIPSGRGTGVENRECLRVRVLVHQDCVGPLFTLANRQGHRFGDSGWFIEQ